LFPNKEVRNRPSHEALFVSVGIAPSWRRDANGKENYRDMVDAMYIIDEWGANVLKEGLRNKKKPFWFAADYNFCNIIDPKTHMENPSFESLMSTLEQAVKEEQTRVTV
jgi:hypothetical protein